MFCDTVGSEKRKARLRTGPLRTVGTQRPYGSTEVSTVQRVIACVGRKIEKPADLTVLIGTPHSKSIKSLPWTRVPLVRYGWVGGLLSCV